MPDRASVFQKSAYLVLALGFQYLSGGDRPVGVAVWLAPIFLLRLFRDAGAIKAFALVVVPLTAIDTLASRGMIPIPSLQATISIHGFWAVMALLPYLLEGLVQGVLPRALRVLLFPSLVVAIPFVRSVQWTYLHPVTALDDLVVLQLASVAGVPGVLFVITLVAAAANDIWEHRRSWQAARSMAALLLGVLLVVYGFGSMRLRSEAAASRVVRAAAIVPDPSMRTELFSSFGTFLRPGPDRAAEIAALRRSWTDVYQQLLSSSIAAGKAGFDLAVWSEGAAIVFEEDERTLIQQAADAARAARIHLGIAIFVYKTSIRPSRSGPYPIVQNKLVLISPAGEIAWEHSKSRLAPGIESAITIPGDGTLKTNDLGISGAICYELDFFRYIGQAGRLGATVLLAPSNDWDAIKNMHARSARLRAIENGVSLFRPAAAGISLATDQYGRTLARMDNSRTAGSPMTAILPAERVPTLFVAWGDWLGWVGLAVVGLCAASAARLLARRRRARRPTTDR
jgi:apolipoprotein N-acyltransferase